jgi:hypothetical protein
VSGNRVFTGRFVSKRDKVAGGSIKLHNEELHNLYSSPNSNMLKKSSGVR